MKSKSNVITIIFTNADDIEYILGNILPSIIIYSTAEIKYIMSVATIKLANVEQICSKVWRVMGCNPGINTLQGTNTYLIGGGSRRCLIDTGESNNDQYITNLTKLLLTENASIDKVIITHKHRDHIGGLARIQQLYLDVTAYKYVDETETLGFQNQKEYVINHRLQDNELIAIDKDITLQCIYTPGHSVDHICLLCVEDGTLYTGDCVLGDTTVVFENLEAYMNSLNRLMSYKINRLCPGHGQVINGQQATKRIQEYILHRNSRNEQILRVLNERGPQALAEQCPS
ncbi:hypothetical protein GJ496_004122 [Pomphorhynchus laevis]|nr:hypothetical protein GJ496_004122 [Pomphorhynchus laevis]